MITETLSRPQMAQQYAETHAQALVDRTQELHIAYEEWVARGAVPKQSSVMLGMGRFVIAWEAGKKGRLAVRVPYDLASRDEAKRAAATQKLEERLPAMVRSIGIDGLEQPKAIGGGRLWSHATRGPTRGTLMSSDVQQLHAGHFNGILDTFVAMEYPGLGADKYGANMVFNRKRIGIVDVGLNNDQPREEKVEALVNALVDPSILARTVQTGNEVPQTHNELSLWYSKEYRQLKAPTPRIAEEFGARIGSLHLLRNVLEDRSSCESGGLWDPSLEVMDTAIRTVEFKAGLRMTA